MEITKVSQYSGKEHTLDLNITDEQLRRFQLGAEKVQNIFPHLTPGECEFLLTGITDEEWNELFPPEEEEGIEPHLDQDDEPTEPTI